MTALSRPEEEGTSGRKDSWLAHGMDTVDICDPLPMPLLRAGRHREGSSRKDGQRRARKRRLEADVHKVLASVNWLSGNRRCRLSRCRGWCSGARGSETSVPTVRSPRPKSAADSLLRDPVSRKSRQQFLRLAGHFLLKQADWCRWRHEDRRKSSVGCFCRQAHKTKIRLILDARRSYLVTWISGRLSTTPHHAPRDINLELAQRISSSLHRDSARAILRRVHLIASRDASTTLAPDDADIWSTGCDYPPDLSDDESLTTTMAT